MHDTTNVSARKARRTKDAPNRKSKSPVFACVMRQVLTHPPIHARGANAPGLWSVFDAAVVVALIALARAQIGELRHMHAFRYAGQQFKKHRRKIGGGWGKEYGRAGNSYAFQLATSTAYQAGREDFDQTGRSNITVNASRWALLFTAGLSDNSRNLRRLRRSLLRLTRSVRAGGVTLPPVLVPDEASRELIVDARWALARTFGRVPLPLPTRGAGSTVVALYLFLGALDRRETKGAIGTRVLFKRLGIARSGPSHARRALEAALKAVNRHLADLDRDGTLEEQELPAGFRIEWLDRGERLRFVEKVDDDERDEDDLDDEDEDELGDEEREERDWRRRRDKHRRDQERLQDAQAERQKMRDMVAKLKGSVG
jgi:hypothetical protein